MLKVYTGKFDRSFRNLERFLKKKEDAPFNPRWLEREGKGNLSDQFDVEGIDDSGVPDSFQENDTLYDEWKKAAGLRTEKMQKTGQLKEAVEKSRFEVDVDGDEVNYTWSWVAIGEDGDNYAYTWQHDNEGDETGDRKLRFIDEFLGHLVNHWEQEAKTKIESYFKK